jgi:hypothetical protein
MRAQPNAGILREAFSSHQKDELCPETLRQILAEIILRHRITDMLGAIIRDEKRVEELTGHAYSHTNGFDKLVLDSLGEFGCKLRLHVWWDNQNDEESTVHDHPWDFASCLLAGEMTMRLYEEDHSAPQAFVKTLYPTQAIPGVREPVIVGGSRLKCIGVSEYAAGMTYVLSRRELHSVRLLSDRLITLVLQGPHVQDTSRVYVKRRSELRSPIVDKYFSSTEIRRKCTWLFEYFAE